MAEKIKVKQSTIDDIKKMGMTKALASAKTNRSAEYQEALRRMYGQRRLDAAMKGAQGGSASRETYMKRGYSGAPTSTGRKTSAGPKMGGGQGYSGSSRTQQQTRNRAAAVGTAYAGAGALVARKVLADRAKNVQRKAITSGPKAITAGKTPMSAKGGASLSPSRASALAKATMKAKETAKKTELAKRGAGKGRPKGASKGTQTAQQKRVTTAKKVARVTKASTKQTLKGGKGAASKALGPIAIVPMVKEAVKNAPKLKKAKGK
jgi:hypothetical protein